ncbi:LPXTG cell wall anchor domain-containing protein [Lentzea sp. NPDC051838]|uniref:LPXTG cell wall anchor domain-containing protein n=1 Tax=Lentzea sp. NPDC051838 TaxID=3154849 RepID=UPI0034435359
MRLTPLRRSGLLGAATVAAVASLALVTTAFAQPDKPAPTSGDQRAVAYSGNVDIAHPDACTVGGLTGTPVGPGEFTFTGGVDKLDLDITAAPEGVTGVVVKGADAYNVYLADKLGALPWNDLRAPDKNEKAPAISHWYACVVKKTPSSSSSSSSSSTTSSSTVTQSSTPSSSSTSTPTSSSEVVATTTTTTVAAPVVDDDLASTGFGSAWLVGLGAALLAAGAAVLFVLRRRRA